MSSEGSQQNARPGPAFPGPAWKLVGRQRDLPEETAVHVDLAGVPICLVRSRGQLHALRDECSHGQVALSDGDVDNGHIECWLHGSKFDLTIGKPTGPPATQPVPVYPVQDVDGAVYIALPDST